MGKRELNFERFDKITAIGNGVLVAGDKVAVYDVSTGNVLIATMTQLAAIVDDVSIDDTAYDESTWNGETDTAASRNAIRDKIVTMDAAIALRPTVVRVTATQTELNAGVELVAADAALSILVTNISILVTGNFATGTSIEVEDASANEVISYAQAQLSDGAILAPDSTGATLKAGYGAPLTATEALVATHTGSAFTAGTSIIFTISYVLV